ncbi:MAG: L,D-transpeptidase family protein [Crocinitomicaceae bacterium]|nr:L,D-transpeptidase family protein [Crocinitomicaceae bacterium]
MKHYQIFIVWIGLFVLSCQSPQKEEAPSLTHLPLNDRLERIFGENKEEKLNFELKFSKEIQQLYTLNSNKSYWFQDDSLSPVAFQLIHFFDSTEYYGLPKHLYPINIEKQGKDPLQIELALTESLFRIIKHFQFGVLDSGTTNISWNLSHLSDSIPLFVRNNFKDSLFHYKIRSFEPQSFHYQWVVRSWKNHLLKNNLDSTRFTVPPMKKDSLKAYQIAREILLHKKYLDSVSYAKDSLFLLALEKYQEDHNLKGDHVIGSNTIVALEKSNWDKFEQVAVVLEKLKWTRDLPEKYFRVNIGEQKLILVDSNRIIREHRIIVGHFDTQTPELQSKMNRIILYPYWNVPHSISSKELVYGARRDTGYMRKNNYKVFRNKEEVDLSTIDWKKYSKDKFPFRIRQEPGPKNSLGLIKFQFPNKHSVYIHDTPTKWLFKTKMRYYSHGCMRLENPRDLAHYLIATDPKNRFIADSLDVELEKAKNQSIPLKQSIPIFIEYRTVNADSTGKISFYNDYYGRDQAIIRALFQKP